MIIFDIGKLYIACTLLSGVVFINFEIVSKKSIMIKRERTKGKADKRQNTFRINNKIK